jgi:outer membrane protein TolC
MKRLLSDVKLLGIGSVFALLAFAAPAIAQTNTNATTATLPGWITQPLSLTDALNATLRQNATISKAKSELEATYGLIVETRAAAFPRIDANGTFTKSDPNFVDKFPFSSSSTGTNTSSTNSFRQATANWNTGVQITQSIYEGGKVLSALRAAKLTKEQALLLYQTTLADTLLATRVAYYDVLLAEQQITVNEASVNLLSRELEDQQRRYEAGTVPRFNVLRAEVAVANQKPNLIRARNAYRIAKNNLVNLLGYNLPREIWEDVPLQLTDKLEAQPYQIALPDAIQQALEKRTELGALRKTEQLQRENIIQAKAGYKPSIQAFAGYGWKNSQFTTDLSEELHGWNVGAQLNWAVFDGLLTRGKVMQARAQHERAQTDLEDNARKIELEVRTAYSSFIEAREVLESQQKVQEEADEALRLAKARTEAGTATQLDVLNAETSLTQARTTQVQALHDYVVARARLERAIGQNTTVEKK